MTGDLVRDALRVGEAEATHHYALFAREAATFTAPVHTVPGNHGIFGVERTRSGVSAEHPLYGRAMYRAFRGPGCYSFDVDDQWYHGHVDSAQVARLARDLAMVPPGVPVITFNHIPQRAHHVPARAHRRADRLPTRRAGDALPSGAATVADTPAGTFTFPSVVTAYRLTNGLVDDGTFIPLKPR